MRTARHDYYDRHQIELGPLCAILFAGAACWYGVFKLITWIAVICQ